MEKIMKNDESRTRRDVGSRLFYTIETSFEAQGALFQKVFF